MKHLTDTQIQELLDHSDRVSPEIKFHLDTCRQCRLQIQTYQSLFRRLEQETDEMPERFADKVWVRLEALQKRAFWARTPETWGLVLAGGFGAYSLIRWIPWKKLLDQMRGFSIELPSIQVPEFISSFSTHLPVVGFAAAVMVVIAVLDVKWVRPKLHI